MCCMRTRLAFRVCVALAAVALTACAPGPNPQAGTTGDAGAAGLLLGLWHGLIAPVTFVISLFTNTVNIYDVRNSGNWYDVGFFLGIVGVLGGGGSGARSRGGR